MNGTAMCQECGSTVYAQEQLCERCSKYLDKCNICCTPADSDINPALVAAYARPEAVEARARSLQAMRAQEAIMPLIIDLRRQMAKPFADQLVLDLAPLKAKLNADLEADPRYVQALAENQRLYSLPRGEVDRETLDASVEELTAACLPHRQAYSAAEAPVIAAFRQSTAVYDRIGDAIWSAMASTCKEVSLASDALLDELIAAARSNKK